MPRIKAKRQPEHAGSWYESDADELAQQIDCWLAAVPAETGLHARAVIAPHAGYRYCGHVMAYAYKHIDASKVRRVFLLGPSHHLYSRKCLLSPAVAYTTPLGDLPVDAEVYEQLTATGQFDVLDLHADEAEHSLELHTPYIRHVLGSQAVTLVPIVIGSLSQESEAAYGQLLGPYLDDPTNLFVVSSDFCHWGARFTYQAYDKSKGSISEYIETLDRAGMEAIEQAVPQPFAKYLAETHNTICGRHPIGVFLQMMQHCSTQHKVQFRKYDQSSKCTSQSDSSVSYAAAIISIV